MDVRESMGAGALGSRYTDALNFATDLHRDQMRKGSRVPYLSHLMSVSALVLEHGGSEDAAIAGLLHDAVEDAPQGTGPEILTGIEDRYGRHVAGIVRECSDGLDEVGHRSGTWAERKVPYLEALGHKTPDALRVTAADKTHNARCIADDVLVYGQEFWTVFNSCRHRVAWYYESVTRAVEQKMPGGSAAVVLRHATDRLLASAGVEARDVQTGLPACGCEIDR